MVILWVLVSLFLFWLLERPKNLPRWSVFILSFYCVAITGYMEKLFESASLFQMIGVYFLLIVPILAVTFFLERAHVLKAAAALFLGFLALIPLSNIPSTAMQRTAAFKNHFSQSVDSKISFIPCNVSQQQFTGFSIVEQVNALQACGKARNPAYISNAIALVDHPNETLALNAALYLEAVTGEHMGADADRWKIYLQSKSTRVNMSLHVALDNPNSELVDKGFSAVMIVDAFQTGQEVGKDFLTIYLQMRHGSEVSQSDLSMLRQRTVSSNCSGESNCFRTGMNYFLLALGETLSIEQGNPGDASTVQGHWEQAINILEQTRELGAPIATATQKILRSADANRDGHLDSVELANIIRSRL